uniref:Uncharacterized protein n=1 Tax=Streptomyces sp. NBC_00049 TaxID=2903617 RepID=A0AAU2JN53_9ACTN
MTPYRRPLARVLLAGAVVLVAGALATRRWGGSHGGLVLLGRASEHLIAMGWPAPAALAGAVLPAVRTPALRIALSATLGLGVPVLFLAGLLSGLAGGQEQTRSAPAPGRDDRRPVVEEGRAMIDPLWFVYVHEGDRPWERRRAVGHFNGDASGNELAEAVWTPRPDPHDHLGRRGPRGDDRPGGRPDRIVSVG